MHEPHTVFQRKSSLRQVSHHILSSLPSLPHHLLSSLLLGVLSERVLCTDIYFLSMVKPPKGNEIERFAFSFVDGVGPQDDVPSCSWLKSGRAQARKVSTHPRTWNNWYEGLFQSFPTGTNDGVNTRLKNYDTDGLRPWRVLDALKAGYTIVARGLLCFAPIPPGALVPSRAMTGKRMGYGGRDESSSIRWCVALCRPSSIV